VEPTDITVHILREIRDEIRETNGRLDQTNTRLEEVRDELGRRIVESETRTATALVSVAGALQDIKQLLTDRLDLRDRVDRCEREIEVLKARIAT
jgi:chromosome segregation ATPase